MLIQRQLQRQTRRSTIFWVFLCSAIPLTIVILGYAAGYNFERETGKIIPTSALSIETTPKDATVTINGHDVEEKTPIVENNITPGYYTVEIIKDGYQEWQKELLLEEGKSLIFPEVVLFANTQPKQFSSASVNVENPEMVDMPAQALPEKFHAEYETLGWHDGNFPTYVTTSGAQVLLIDNEKSVSYIVNSLGKFSDENRIQGNITIAEWSKEKNSLLYVVNDIELWVYNSTDNSHTLVLRESVPITSATWHTYAHHILYSNAAGIHAIELDARDTRQVWKINDIANAQHLAVSKKGIVLWFDSQGSSYTQTLCYEADCK